MNHIFPITRPALAAKKRNIAKDPSLEEIERIEWVRIHQSKDRFFVMIKKNGTFMEMDYLAYSVLVQKNCNCCESDKQEVYKELSLLWKRGIFKAFTDREIIDNEKSLRSVNINISQRCNLNCVYCFAGGGTYGNNEGDIDEKLLHNAMQYAVKNKKPGETINFVMFGGEPTLRKDLLYSAFEYANRIEEEKHINVICDIFTNGTLLDEVFVDSIKENPRIRLLISLDGPGYLNDHDRSSKNGMSVSTIIENNMWNVLRIPQDRIVVRGTLYQMKTCLVERVEYLANLGFKNIVFDVAYGFEIDSANILKKVKSELPALSNYLITRIKTKKPLNINFISETISRILMNNPNTNTNYFEQCPAGRKYIAIDIHGNVYPCHFLVGKQSYLMGSIEEGVELCNMVKDNGVVDLRKSKFGKCVDCDIQHVCEGPCVYKQLSLFRERHEVIDEYCELMHARLAESMHVLASIYARDRWPYRNEWKAFLEGEKLE